MATVDRRKEMREALLKKTQESYDRRDDTGMYSDIFLEVEGLQKWKCKEGQHIGDIIPYRAGNKDPNNKEGQWAYVLDIWVHQRVGVNQDTFVCPARNYNQPCPICEHREQQRSQDDYDEDYVKSLYPKRRSVYNWVCYDDAKEEAKGVQVWDVAHFFMEKKLLAIAKAPARSGTGGGFVAFSDPDDGRSVQFERKGAGRENTEFLGHQFVPRDGYTISDEILQSAYQLDQIIHIPTYEELYESFFGGAMENQEKKPEEVQEPPEEDEEKPPTKPTRLLRRGAPVVEEGEEPPPTRRPTRIERPKPKTEGECPAGGTFGVDCEELKECGDCEVWDDCSAEKDKIRAKEPTPTRKGPSPVIGKRGPIGRK